MSVSILVLEKFISSLFTIRAVKGENTFTWLIKGCDVISTDLKRRDLQTVWAWTRTVRTGGIYQDSLLTDVRTIALFTFDKNCFFCTEAHPKFHS